MTSPLLEKKGLCRLRIVVLHEIANLGPSGLAGPIPAGGVFYICHNKVFKIVHIKFIMDKFEEERIREIVREEIKKAERRKEAEEMRKDPSSIRRRIQEIK
jgi:hypothetical protein